MIKKRRDPGIKLFVSLIVLYDYERRYLLQHRTADAERLPDHWAFFGGGIKKNETPVEAVHRETFEELNYRLNDPMLVLDQPFMIDGIDGYMYVFIESLRGGKSDLRLQEGQGWGWFHLSEIRPLKMIERDRDILRRIEEFLNR